MPYSPLGRGFLTGAIDATTTFDESDNRVTLPRFSVEARTANEAVVETLRRLADAHGATPAQIGAERSSALADTSREGAGAACAVLVFMVFF